MTEALSRHAPQSHPFDPDDDTPVLVNRELRPGIDPATISRFGDNRWHLSPAVHEDHYRSFSSNFQLVPAAFRRLAKVYVWMELNHDQDR